MARIRVATVQFQHRAGDKTYNFAQVEQHVAAAAADGVKTDAPVKRTDA